MWRAASRFYWETAPYAMVAGSTYGYMLPPRHGGEQSRFDTTQNILVFSVLGALYPLWGALAIADNAADLYFTHQPPTDEGEGKD
jgi:hypothetical protein